MRNEFESTNSQDGGQDTDTDTNTEATAPAQVVQANAVRVQMGPDGIVNLPAGTDISLIFRSGTDLVVPLPDGGQMIIENGAVIYPQLVIGTANVPPTTVAALLIQADPPAGPGDDGDPNNDSSGGNFAAPVGGIGPDQPLGDLLPPTELLRPLEQREEPGFFLDEDPELVIESEFNTPGVPNAFADVEEEALAARGDEPEGSNEPSAGEVTRATIIFEGAAGAVIEINGVVVTGPGQVINGEFGTITIVEIHDGSIVIDFELNDNVDGDGNQEVIDVVITNPNGESADGTLTIDIIDDAPTARDDVDSLMVGDESESGNVLTGADTDSGADGADTEGADGASVTNVSSDSGSAAVVDGGVTIDGEYGQLTINPDGSYTYVPNPDAPGGVSDTFTYTLTDGDGDSDEATLTINFPDTQPEISVPNPGDGPGSNEAGTLVDEAGLPARAGESEGSDEPANSETTSGVISFVTGDGANVITIDGVAVTSVGQTFESPEGTLTITSISDSQIGYSFTLADNTDGDATSTSFDVEITDADGDSASGELVINIADDVPTAADDNAGQGSEDAPITVDAFANDVPGADSVDLVNGVELVEGSLVGDGAVAYNDDGTFTYMPAPGEEGTVTFEYQITDGDGDTSTATVTIELLPDSTPTISIVDGSDTVVDEAGLNPDGSDAASDSEIASGSLTFDTGNDTVGSLVINGVDVTNGGTVTGAYGTLTVTGNPTDGYEYSYELTTNLDDVAGAETDDFTVVLTDSDGDTADTTLSIEIVDDVPTANDDSANQASEDADVTVDVFANDVGGADGVDLVNGVALVPGTLSGPGTLTYNDDGTFTYDPVPGEEGTVTFQYEITDGDGDTSIATVTIELLPDSTPEIAIVDGSDTVVDEAALDGPPNGQAPGSNAASNDEVAEGSLTFDTGNDTVGSLVIGGVDVTNGGTVTGAYGKLTVTGNPTDGYEYSYELTTNLDDVAGAETDDFSVVLTDSDGDTADTTLSIEIIDDVPTAEDDADSISEASGLTSTDGNVITGVGTDSGAAGEDTEGADGAEVSNPGVYVGTYGTLTLNADGSYDYVLSQFGIDTMNALSDGESVSEEFDYTLTDGDGDSDPATLTFTLNGENDIVTINGLDGQGPELTVDEDDLASSTGNPADGGSDQSDPVTDSNSFTFDAPDGVDTVTVGGADVIVGGVFGGPVSVPTGIGVLTITGFTPVTDAAGNVVGGEFTYEYELTDNWDAHANAGEDGFTESFEVVVTDEDGDDASASIDVDVIDDVPTAEDDEDSISEASGLTSTDGNVITGAGTDSGAAGEDTEGADGAQVSNPGIYVGTYGTLTLNADGSYDYVLSQFGIDTMNALSDGESVEESFDYTLTDGDGDSDPATLTFTLNGENDIITLNGLDGQGPELSVDEDDLSPDGSDQSDPTTDSDAFSFDAPDGMGNITIDGVDVIVNGAYVGGTVVINGDYGTLTITGFTPTLDAAGNLVSGTFDYSYELTTNTEDHSAAGEDNVVDSFDVVATDEDGDMANGSLDVAVIDDIPTATLDMNSVGEGGSVGGNVITNDVIGADGAAVGGPVTGVVAGDDTSNPVSGGVGVAVAGTYGTLTLNADGSYTYEANANVGDVEDVFVYTITDADGDTSTVTLTIDVEDSGLAANNEDAAVNEAELAIGSTPNAPEQASGDLNDNVVGGAGGNSFALVGSGMGSNGTLVINPDGTWTYTLNSPVDGTDADNGANTVNNVETFTYEVTDMDGNTTTSTITIDIIDDVPTAVMDSDTVSEGADVSGNVVDNDTIGADGAEVADNEVTGVAAGSVAGPVSGNVGASVAGLYGTLTINADGSYTYESNPDAVMAPGATDTFTYTITDGDGDTSTTTIEIDVTDVTLVADNDTITVDEDGLDGIGSQAGTDNETATGDLDVNGAVSYALVGSNVGSNGTLTLNPDGSYSYTLTSPVDGTTLDNGQNTVMGVDSFTYVATDADGNTVQGTITIDVIDDVPTATADTDTVVEGADTMGNVLTNDVTGADGGAPGGTVTGVAAGDNTASPVSGNVGVVVAGTYGNLTLNADGSYTYDANPNVGDVEDVFVYTITDGDGDTSTVTLTIDVDDSNLAANNEDGLVNEAELAIGSTPNTPVEATGDLSDNVSGGNGGNSFAIVGSGVGSNGTLVINPDGTWTYTLTSPVDGADADNGTNTVDNVETFTYEVTDADGNTTQSTIMIDITDDVPTAVLDTDSVVEGGTTNGDVDVNDTFGADGGEVTGVAAGNNTASPVSGNVGVVVAGTYGDLTLNADGSYSYDADPNVGNVQDVFVYTITDGDGDTSTVTLTIDVTDSGLAATNEDASVFEAQLADGSAPNAPETASGSLTDNVSGGNGGNSYALVGSGTGSNGTLILNPDGSWTYTLNDNFDSTPDANDGNNVEDNVETFTYEVTDADGNTSQSTITIDIVDDVPTAVDDTYNQATENSAIEEDVSGNDVAGADGVQIFSLVGGSLMGAGDLTFNDDGTFVYNPADNEEGTVTFDYTVTDNDGDVSQATVTINLQPDSNPVLQNAVAALDDDGLMGGNPGGVGDLDANAGEVGAGALSEAVYTGTFSANFGNDTPGSFNLTSMDGQTATVGTEDVEYSVSGNTLVATITSGPRTGTDLFQVSVNPATGDYSVILLTNVLHDPMNDENDATASITVTAVDSENESTTASLDITFDDDTPVQGDITDVSTSNDPLDPVVIGSLELSIGADGFGALDLSLDTTGLSVGGNDVITEQVGNVLTAYADTNDDGMVDGGDTVVFTLTADPDAGASGTYTFDLVQSFDGEVVEVDIGGSTGFGAGPVGAQVLTANAAPGSQPLSVVSGYDITGAFNAATWQATGVATGLVADDVNGSTNGWGVDNQNFNNSEFFNWDFGSGALDDQDGPGGYEPPNGVNLPDITFASFTFKGASAGNEILYVVKFTDGTFDSGAITGSDITGEWTYTAPAGKFIADIEMLATSVGGGGVKVDLESVGVADENVDIDLDFTVKSTDADGDMASDGFSINVSDSAPSISNLTAAVFGAEGSLSEGDLVSGSSPAPKGPTVLSGDFTVASPDGVDTVVIGGVTIIDGGSLVNSGPIAMPLGGSLAITGYNAATGEITYEYTLGGAQDHSGGDVFDTIDVVLTDPDGDSDSGELAVQILDDGPIAANDAASVSEVTQDFNVAFVLDYSGSVSNSELNVMLQAVESTVDALFNGTGGDVTVTLIAFSHGSPSSGALTYGPFTSAADVEAQLDAINPNAGGTRPYNGRTNFSAALQETIDNFDIIPGAENQVYFLSDGNPNEGRGPGGATLTTTVQTNWQNFINNNDLDVTSIGIGNNVSDSRLQDVDLDGSGSVLRADTFSDLIDTLLEAIRPDPISGDVLPNDTPGADGVRVESIIVEGVTYVWDGVSQITPSNGDPVIVSAILEVDTSLGGTLIFNFSSGEWIYTPPATVSATTDEVFGYSLVDGDGSQAVATLTITVEDALGGASASLMSVAQEPLMAPSLASNDNQLFSQQSGTNFSLALGGAMIAGMSSDFGSGASMGGAAIMASDISGLTGMSSFGAFTQFSPLDVGAGFGASAFGDAITIAAPIELGASFGDGGGFDVGGLDAIAPITQPVFAPQYDGGSPLSGDAIMQDFAASDMIAMPGADGFAALAALQGDGGEALGTILSDALMGGDMDPVDALLANIGEGGMGEGGLAAIAPLGDFANFNMGFEGGFTLQTQDIMMGEAMVLHHDAVMSA